MNRIVITEYENKILTVFVKNDIPVKIRAFNSITEYTGAVYLGRVKTVKKNISSAFISYDNGKMGFINKKNLKPETVMPIMLKKQTSGQKEDVVTDIITIAGIYCVVGNNIKGINKSKKLNDFSLDGYDFDDVLLRTNAKNTTAESVYNEYKYLSNILATINEVADKRTDNSILFEGTPCFVNSVFSEDICEYDEILTDIDDAFKLFNSIIDDYKSKGIDISIPVKLYNDAMVPLNAMLSLSSKLDRAMSRKVYLKSDAFIVIDYTEAMTVIDVNSGTTRFKGDRDDVFHSINMEAAEEIILQLKLRNLSGIIIVDFINVRNKELNNQLIAYMIEELKKDDAHARCHGMTKLGLVEITRDRVDLPLREQLKSNINN